MNELGKKEDMPKREFYRYILDKQEGDTQKMEEFHTPELWQ